jgi:hypothetical protein
LTPSTIGGILETYNDERMTMDTMVMEEQYVLDATDRCDRCGSQAYVWVNMVAGDLQFCGHHYAKHENKLKHLVIEVVDERDKLNVKVASSA